MIIVPAIKYRRSRESGSPLDAMDSRFRGNDELRVFKGRVNST